MTRNVAEEQEYTSVYVCKQNESWAANDEVGPVIVGGAQFSAFSWKQSQHNASEAKVLGDVQGSDGLVGDELEVL